jgi:hypothetical protein
VNMSNDHSVNLGLENLNFLGIELVVVKIEVLNEKVTVMNVRGKGRRYKVVKRLI